jgi:hypothetical protein
MVSGVMVAVLKELHADHIVLSDSSCIPFAEGLVVLDQIAPGSRITIVYSRNDDGGGMVVESIKHSISIEEFPYLPTLLAPPTPPPPCSF